MKKSIKISDEDKKLIKKIAKEDGCYESTVISRAIRNYAKAKKII